MNNKIGVQIVALLALFLLLFTAIPYSVYSVPPVTQDVIIVDVNGNGDYTSIKEAISNANATDIIMVMNGVYNECELNIGKKIEIVGEDPIYTILNCSGDRGFSLGSSYIEISNLQIINVRDYAISVSSKSVGCTISNCIIHTLDGGIGVELSSSYNMVSDCDLYGYNKNGQGVKIQRGGFNVVKNCNINTFGNGILVLLDSMNNNIQNCNLFNNEVAIDVRLNSDNNFVTNCNIYSNLESIRLWQNSDNNLVYLNNFWKNDETANDQGNNSWDSGGRGNYWDTYLGVDSDDDGIGDTSFRLSGGVDRYPLMDMILPEDITIPTNLKHISSRSDGTPTFTWSPSMYSKEIKGYYVKIDSDKEEFIGYVTSWTSTESISDGVHKFYVRAEGSDGATSGYASLTFSIDTSFIDTDGDGWSDVEESQYGTDPDDPDNYPVDTDGDRVPNAADTDDDNDGYSDSMETSYGTSTIAADIYPVDTDSDGVPDDDSPDGKYAGDVDDDDDYLIDTVEEELGSNPLNSSDVNRIYIAARPYYLVDTSRNGVFDVLYEQTSGNTSSVEKQGDNYLIDLDVDGSWDYVYNAAEGTVSEYEEERLTLTLPVWILIITIIVVSLLLVFVYYYLKHKPKRVRKVRKPAKAVKKARRIEFEDRREMISQTKDLLGHIQKDVMVYMEKLNELEDQLQYASLEKGEEAVEEKKTFGMEDVDLVEAEVERLSLEKKQVELEDADRIEADVDELLFRLWKKAKH